MAYTNQKNLFLSQNLNTCLAPH